MFTGTADAVRVWCVIAIRQLLPAFTTVVMLVVLRLVTRRQWAAIAIGMVGIFVRMSSFGSVAVLPLEIAAQVVIVVLFTVVMIRFGLLAALTALFVSSVGQTVPLTLNVTHWSAASSNQTLMFLVALTLWAFYASRAGAPVFGRLD
jgi:hypothetical protein